MNTTTLTATRTTWSRILCIGGGIAMLVGAIDPTEGSLLVARRLESEIKT